MSAKIGSDMANGLELLAPAKDKNCAISAINFGADAIYIGANAFGARKNAANNLQDIKDVVDYAHKFFARVYVALNTILRDEELDDVQKLLYDLYEIGVDGIIVQDFGIFKLDLPPFLISASTQCDIRDSQKVNFFENIGVDRVILARELSLSQIKDICKSTDVEVETFIHGALCVSYSGQCYLSYALGGRSANRGECAQPCRKKYTLIDENGKVYAKNKHLLSLKDFCAAPCLDDLVKAGVVSFKIEGRLKDENYVKNVVAYYNILLEKYKRISSGKVFCDFESNVAKSFNRGFSTYFLKGRADDIYNFDTPKQIGEKIGVAKIIAKDFFEIKTDVKINAQDGLCYFSNDSLEGFLVNKVEFKNGYLRVFPNSMPKINVGTIIYRNFDFEFDKLLRNSKTKRQIGVEFFVFEDKILVLDGDGCSSKMPLDTKERANNQETMRFAFENQLRETGESDFYVKEIVFKTDNLPFLKISQINTIRRDLLEKLMTKRLEKYDEIRKNRKKKKISCAPFPLKNNDYRLNIHNKKAQEFYKECNVGCSERSFESEKVKNAELMRTKHCLRRAFNMCLKGQKEKEKLFLLDENAKKLRLEFDCKKCEMVIKEF